MSLKRKNEEEGGGDRATTRRMDDGVGKKRRSSIRLPLHPTLTSSLLMVILLLFGHIHFVSAQMIACRITNKGSDAKPVTNVSDSIDVRTTEPTARTPWCFVLYTIEGKGDVGYAKAWGFELHTYLAAPDYGFYISDICGGRNGCSIRTTKFTTSIARVDFVCCCNTPICNDPSDLTMNPHIQYQKQLKANKSQACFVRYDKSGVQDCTRLTNETTSESPTRCLSSMKQGKQKIGCAHNGTQDRCSWAAADNEQNASVCRLHNNEVQCCCQGLYCNGKADMNISCRSLLSKYDGTAEHWKFKYGFDKCQTLIPATVTLSTSHPDDTTTTTTDSSDLLIILLSVAGALLLLALVGCVICFVLLWRRRKKQKEAAETKEEPAANEGQMTAEQKAPAAEEEKEDVGPRDEYINLTYKQIKNQKLGTNIEITRKILSGQEDGAPLMRNDCGLECRKDDVHLYRRDFWQWHPTQDTGFLGPTHYGYNLTKRMECMLKRYDAQLLRGYDFSRKSVKKLAKSYVALQHPNLVPIFAVHLPLTESPGLLIATDQQHITQPLSMLTAREEDYKGDLASGGPNCYEMYGIGAQVMNGVTYLQSRGLHCYNLKGNNIMVCYELDGKTTLKLPPTQGKYAYLTIPLVKLTDFAFPDVIAEYVKRKKDRALARPNSNLEYWPPEVRTKYEFNEHTTSYMCAMVMIEMWGNFLKPFAKLPPEERSSLFGDGKRANETPPLPDGIANGSYLALVITRMSDKDPKKRPWPYEAAHVLNEIFWNYVPNVYSRKAGKNWPAKTWDKMFINKDSIHPGPIAQQNPLPPLPNIKPPAMFAQYIAPLFKRRKPLGESEMESASEVAMQSKKEAVTQSIQEPET